RIRPAWPARSGRDARRPPGDREPSGAWDTGARGAAGLMTLTFFFSDIEDSTGLLGRLGDAYPDAIAASRRLIRNAGTQQGGREKGGGRSIAAETSTLASSTAPRRVPLQR